MSANQRGTGGTMQTALLRAVMLGAESIADIRNRIGGIIAKPEVARMVNSMHVRGFLHIGRGGRISLTTKARDLASFVEPVPMKPYVPPTPMQRRAGSMDYARLPSVDFGVQREWRHPV